MPLNPQTTYVHLSANGVASELPGGSAFWSLPEDQMVALGTGRLISEYEFTSWWARGRSWYLKASGTQPELAPQAACCMSRLARERKLGQRYKLAYRQTVLAQ